MVRGPDGAGAGFLAAPSAGAGVGGLDPVGVGLATVVADGLAGGRGADGTDDTGRGGALAAEGGGGGAPTGEALDTGGGGRLILTVGAAVGLGGKAMRTVSFFVGCTLAASPGLGGRPPAGTVGLISDIFC